MIKALLAISLAGCLFSCVKPWDNKVVKDIPGDKIQSFEYSYSGTMMWFIEWYCIERGEDGKLQLLYSKDCSPEITILRCPDNALEKIDGFVRKYKLWNLKNSYVPKFEVLDGYMWHMYIRYDGGSISTGGSNAWPSKDLMTGLSAITSYVESVIEASTEADVIGTDNHNDRRER